MIRLALLAAFIVTLPLRALEVVLANPITLSVVVDRLELVEESDGLAVGSDRTLVQRFSFSKPLSVETNGVSLVGVVRFDAEVTQATSALATTEGSGKTYDALTRAKQSQVARNEAMRRLRPAILSAKERVERPSP